MQVPAYAVSRAPSAFSTPGPRPAGQVSATSIGVTTGSEPGNPAPGLNIYGWDNQGRPLDAMGNVLPSSLPSAIPGGPTTPGMSSGDTALYNTVGSALNTTGATIASIVASNNQTQIAQLQAQTQQQIATLQAAATQAQQQGNLTLAQQNAQAAAQLQQFNAMLMARTQPTNTALYVVAGIAGLIIIGGIVWAASSRETRPAAARANPRRSRR